MIKNPSSDLLMLITTPTPTINTIVIINIVNHMFFFLNFFFRLVLMNTTGC